jgi:hypothetical protein
MTDEEMGKMSKDELMKAFFESGIKVAEAKGAYEAARLRLMQMQADPNTTDEQRETIRKVLAECS